MLMGAGRLSVLPITEHRSRAGRTREIRKQRQTTFFQVEESPRFRTRTLLWLFNPLLGLSLVATPIGVLVGEPKKVVVGMAIPWMLWLMNELVWSILGKYRELS